MTDGLCQHCGAWIQGEDETGYVDWFCSMACQDALEDEEEERKREAKEDYQ